MPSDDRRTRKTKQALRQALIELIDEKGFRATSVKDIVARADVGRSTFYDHYADKLDLLQGGITQLGEQLLKEAEKSDSGHPALRFVEPAFEHAKQHRFLYARLQGTVEGAFVRELTLDLWASLLRTQLPGMEGTVQFLAGGLDVMLSAWVRSPSESTDDAAGQFRELAERVLANPDTTPTSVR